MVYSQQIHLFDLFVKSLVVNRYWTVRKTSVRLMRVGVKKKKVRKKQNKDLPAEDTEHASVM